MLKLTIEDLARIIGVEPSAELSAERMVSGFSTDCHKIKGGNILFVFGEPRFNQIQFLIQAQANGAVAAVVEEKYVEVDLPQLLVSDTFSALASVATWWRRKCDIKLISVSGCRGKSTVKNILLDTLVTLENEDSVHGQDSEFDVEFRLPLTLLNLNEKHQISVVEIDSLYTEQVRFLAKIAQPNMVIITNSEDYCESGFSCFTGAGVAASEVLSAMNGGVAILNADDPRFYYWCRRAAHLKVVSFGIKSLANVMADNIMCSNDGCQFTVTYQEQYRLFKLPWYGQHDINNALAAITALIANGNSLYEVVTPITKAINYEPHLNVLQGFNGCCIIDDSYSADPNSLQGAKNYLRLCTGFKWVIVGDLTEYSDNAVGIHIEFGLVARELEFDQLLSYGELARHALFGFSDRGHHFTDIKSLINFVKSASRASDTIFVKGMKSMRMERVVDALFYES